MSVMRLVGLAALFTIGAAAPAMADTCLGKTPATGSVIEGTVLHVLDGQRLCLAKGPTPDQWIEVQVLDDSQRVADSQVSKAALMNVAFSKKMSCVVTANVDGHAVARCSVDKRPVVDLVSHADPVQVASWIAPIQTTRMASAQ